jgi:hypothetical protein
MYSIQTYSGYSKGIAPKGTVNWGMPSARKKVKKKKKKIRRESGKVSADATFLKFSVKFWAILKVWHIPLRSLTFPDSF